MRHPEHQTPHHHEHEHLVAPPTPPIWLIGAVKGALSGLAMFAGSRVLRRTGLVSTASHRDDAVAAAAVAGICTVMGAKQEDLRQRSEASYAMLEWIREGKVKIVPKSGVEPCVTMIAEPDEPPAPGPRASHAARIEHERKAPQSPSPSI